MTGPGHAEKEALQREAKEEAVAGQAGAEARSVRELGRGRGSGSRTSGRRGVPAAPLRGVGVGGGSARAIGILSPQSPWKGWERMENWGRGIPPSSNGAPSPQVSGEEMTPPTHIR